MKVERLQQWLKRFDGNSDLELELDCFNGTAYLKVPKTNGIERIDLEDGSIQVSSQGRISCLSTSIQEVERDSLLWKSHHRGK